MINNCILYSKIKRAFRCTVVLSALYRNWSGVSSAARGAVRRGQVGGWILVYVCAERLSELKDKLVYHFELAADMHQRVVYYVDGPSSLKRNLAWISVYSSVLWNLTHQYLLTPNPTNSLFRNVGPSVSYTNSLKQPPKIAITD